MPLPFRALMGMDKKIAGLPQWSEPDSPDKGIRLAASLDVGEATLQGLELIGRARIDSPQSDISFSLTYFPTSSRRDAVSLARLDWRPRTSHTNNDEHSPPALFMVEISGTHHHSFELNWLSAHGRPLKWLPVAEPINPDFQGFIDLLDGVGKIFRINDIGVIPEPSWAQDLFS